MVVRVDSAAVSRQDNADRLRALMERHAIDQEDVAILARVSGYTVLSWLRDPTTGAYRAMPDAALELLWFKLDGNSCFTDVAAGPRRRRRKKG